MRAGERYGSGRITGMSVPGALVTIAAAGALLCLVAVPAAATAGAMATAGSAASWQIQPSPGHTGSYNFLSSVSCVTGGTCVAVGRYSAGAKDRPLTMVRTGSTWKLESTPVIKGLDYSDLSSVSCVSPNLCIAVGSTITNAPASIGRALAEEWNGKAWAVQKTPVPRGGPPVDIGVGLTSVSCTSAHSCLAVGGYYKNELSTQQQPLAESWNGTTWSLVHVPNPQAENGSGLDSVDCVTSDRCEAVGFFDYADIDQSAIADSWNGSTWSGQRPVNPGGQSVNTLSSVFCTAAAACTSVGTWTGDFPLTLAERWNGAGWTRQAFADPPKTVTSDLSGVACTGANACVAVGSWANNENSFPSLAMTARWNGTAWSRTPTQQPKGNNAALAAVSCPAAGACVAVGASIGSSPGAETLVEVR